MAAMAVSPADSHEDKARHLRALYRRNGGERASAAVVGAEFARLFPAGEARLDHILVSAWTEGRELAGWTYDHASQG